MKQSIRRNGTNIMRIIFLAGILIVLLFLPGCRGNSKPSINTISSEAAEEIVMQANSEYRDVTFGGKFILLGANLVKGAAGMQIELVWKSPVEQPLVYSNAIHLMDRQGNILSTLDYPQDKEKGIVKAGTLWLNRIDIPESKLENVALIGIGIYSMPDVQLLPIDKGPRDGAGKRLLMALPSIHTIHPGVAAEFASKTNPEHRDIGFGNKFFLIGIQQVKTGEGLELQFVWKSVADQRLSFINAVHLLDHKGNILSTLDYPQDKAKVFVKANTLWVNKVDIPRSKLEEVAAVGIGIYSLPDAQLLSVDKGSRDWGGKRLVIGLPSISTIGSNIPTARMPKSWPNYPDILFKVKTILLQINQFAFNAPQILIMMLVLGVILRLMHTGSSIVYQLQLSTIGLGFTLILWSHDALLFSLWFILTFILMHLFSKPVRAIILCGAYIFSIFYFRGKAGSAFDSMIWACPLQLQFIRSIDIVTAEANLEKPLFARLLNFTSYMGTPVNVNHWYYVRYKDWISHLDHFNGIPALRDKYTPLLKRTGWIILLLIASAFAMRLFTTRSAANSLLMSTGYKVIYLIVFWPLMNHLLFLGADWIDTPGIELCKQPVLTSSPIDYWRRQQLGIATFFREKVYDQSWGGGRSRYRNLFYTFVLIGLWHSLTYPWMIWGILWGGVMVINRYYRQTLKPAVMKQFREVPWLYSVLCWLATMFTLVFFDFIIGRNRSLPWIMTLR